MNAKLVIYGVSAVWFAGLVIYGLTLGGKLTHPRGSNWRNASGSLKTLGTAQADFRSNDRDGNGVNDFWVRDIRGLYYLAGPDGEAIKLIEVTIARADAFPVPPPDGVTFAGPIHPSHPKAGYRYAAIPINARGRTMDPRTEFGVCTWPASYPHSGRLTLILNEENSMWKKDNGGRRVLRWPADPIAEGWSPMD